jgi:RNA polymerase sigma-70 factor (ECF subfamily)
VSFVDWSDGELMAAVVLRDEGAFAEVFDRHFASVTSAIAVVLGTDSRRNEVAAEVFFDLWTSPEAFDPRHGSLLGFLRAKGRASSVDLLRSDTAMERPDDADG